MYRLDESLRQLIETGLKQGHLLFSQVNAFLPDEATDPLQLDNLISCLEELNMQIVADPVKDDAANRSPSAKNGVPKSGSTAKTHHAAQKIRFACICLRWARFHC
jgi:hypothetical protein